MRLRSELLGLLLLVPGLAHAATDDPPTLTIDEISCRGNVVTTCDFILGHLYLAAGDVLDEDEIGNARLRLMSLPSFQSVDIYLEKGSVRDRVRVVIDVVEADPDAREWLSGTSWRVGSLSQLLAGRFTRQNVFGPGKLLDVSLLAFEPVSGRVRREYAARAQYVDPHWLGSKRSYLIAGVSGGQSEYQMVDWHRYRVENAGLDVAVGRRIFDFSHLSLSYRYNAYIETERTTLETTATTFSIVREQDSLDNHVLGLSYGWNSEDDPYFPTLGSRASLSWLWVSSGNDLVLDGGFRKTWTTESGTSWRVQIEDTPGTEYRAQIDENFEWMAGFARPIAGSADGEIRRGRWYIDAGYTPQGGGYYHRSELGLKIGVRLETRSFGLVELYVIGSGLYTDHQTQW